MAVRINVLKSRKLVREISSNGPSYHPQSGRQATAKAAKPPHFCVTGPGSTLTFVWWGVGRSPGEIFEL